MIIDNYIEYLREEYGIFNEEEKKQSYAKKIC